MKKFRQLFFLLFFLQVLNVKFAQAQRGKTIPHFTPFWVGVKADVMRLYGRYSPSLLLRAVLFARPFRPLFTMRLCQAVCYLPEPLRLTFLLPCRGLHYLAQQLAGMDLGWDTAIGPGMLINHGWGFVTGRGSDTDEGITFGSNVTVFQGVTIGVKHRFSENGRIRLIPKIEDDVWIGPHAVITGEVVIGRGSRIAPGTIVTGNVEPFSIVGGNPMRVLKTNAEADVLRPAKLAS